MPFSDTSLSQSIISALPRNLKSPTEIQSLAIPIILEKHDVLAIAQTGSGKTLAYGLPLIDIALKLTTQAQAQAIIIVPTRELAAQVQLSINAISKPLGIHTITLCGGVEKESQIEQLHSQPEIMVATPGRLLELINDKAISTSDIHSVVLDEADRLMDMGFWPDIEKILNELPAERQTLLFSATFPSELEHKAQSILSQPKLISAASLEDNVATRIDESLYLVNKGSKANILAHFVKLHAWSQVLVFISARDNADALCKKLNKAGINSAALHGNKSQIERENLLEKFKTNQLTVLVATDLLARGVHIDDLPVIVNFDLPSDPNTYVHRIGRTARAGKQGSALSLVSHGEIDNLDTIRALTARSLPLEQLEAFPVTDKPSSGGSKRAPKDKQANRRTNKKKSIKQFQGKPKR